MQLQTALGDVEFDFVAIADKGERSAVAFSNNNSRGCRRVGGGFARGFARITERKLRE